MAPCTSHVCKWGCCIIGLTGYKTPSGHLGTCHAQCECVSKVLLLADDLSFILFADWQTRIFIVAIQLGKQLVNRGKVYDYKYVFDLILFLDIKDLIWILTFCRKSWSSNLGCYFAKCEAWREGVTLEEWFFLKKETPLLQYIYFCLIYK